MATECDDSSEEEKEFEEFDLTYSPFIEIYTSDLESQIFNTVEFKPISYEAVRIYDNKGNIVKENNLEKEHVKLESLSSDGLKSNNITDDKKSTDDISPTSLSRIIKPWCIKHLSTSDVDHLSINNKVKNDMFSDSDETDKYSKSGKHDLLKDGNFVPKCNENVINTLKFEVKGNYSTQNDFDIKSLEPEEQTSTECKNRLDNTVELKIEKKIGEKYTNNTLENENSNLTKNIKESNMNNPISYCKLSDKDNNAKITEDSEIICLKVEVFAKRNPNLKRKTQMDKEIDRVDIKRINKKAKKFLETVSEEENPQVHTLLEQCDMKNAKSDDSQESSVCNINQRGSSRDKKAKDLSAKEWKPINPSNAFEQHHSNATVTVTGNMKSLTAKAPSPAKKQLSSNMSSLDYKDSNNKTSHNSTNNNSNSSTQSSPPHTTHAGGESTGNCNLPGQLPPPHKLPKKNLLIRRSMRLRLIHLLAVRNYNKMEILMRMSKEGCKQKDRRNVIPCFMSVSIQINQSYQLRPNLWRQVKEDWPFYTDEEKIIVRQNKAQHLSPSTGRDKGQSSSCIISSPAKEPSSSEASQTSRDPRISSAKRPYEAINEKLNSIISTSRGTAEPHPQVSSVHFFRPWEECRGSSTQQEIVSRINHQTPGESANDSIASVPTIGHVTLAGRGNIPLKKQVCHDPPLIKTPLTKIKEKCIKQRSPCLSSEARQEQKEQLLQNAFEPEGVPVKMDEPTPSLPYSASYPLTYTNPFQMTNAYNGNSWYHPWFYMPNPMTPQGYNY